MKIRKYNADQAGLWDDFCSAAGGVILQKRKFLDYHGDRFEDFSVLGDRGGIKFLFPANVVGSTLYSHSGSTFGGMVCDDDYLAVKEYYDALIEFYRAEGIKKVQVKLCPPNFAMRDDSQLYVLHCLSQSVDLKLGSVIELDRPFKYHQKKRNSLNRAKRAEIVCGEFESRMIAPFYELIIENLAERHETKPVHSLAELLDLHGRLGEESRFYGAFDGAGDLLSGVWLILYKPGVWHTQYISSTEEGRKLGAVDLLIDDIVSKLSAERCIMLSFGVSNYPGEKRVNEGLFRFKSRFGSKSCVNATFSIAI